MQIFRSLANGGWTDVDGEVTGEELLEAFRKLSELRSMEFCHSDRSEIIRNIDGKITRHLCFSDKRDNVHVCVLERGEIKLEVQLNSVYTGKSVGIGSLSGEDPSVCEKMRDKFVAILRELRKQKPNWPNVGVEQ